MSEKKLNIYLVSDCTGDTLKSVSNAVTDRFSDVDFKEVVFPLIRTEGEVDKIFEKIEKPALVMYTIVDDNVRTYLKKKCTTNQVEYVPVLSHIVSKISNLLSVKTNNNIGKKFELDEDYFSWVEAMNFAISHDDGNMIDDVYKADIILVGVSRTSKSPTSVYLAYRGYKTANVPFVINSPLLDDLSKLKDKFIVGLTISPERLIDIRKHRLLTLNDNSNSDYVDFERVMEETLIAKKFFIKNSWPTIDVTLRSVEETASKILKLYQEKYGL